MWYKIGGVIMILAERLNITPKRALAIFYKSKTCEHLHNPDTGLYLYSDGYIADEVIIELNGSTSQKNPA